MSMFPIATNTVIGYSTSTVDFTSIPQNFTHLQLRVFWNTAATGAGDYILATTFNGDAYPNTNYSMHYLNSNGTAISSGSEINNWNATAGDLGKYGSAYITPNANTFGFAIMDILDYSNINKNKSAKSFSGYENNTQGGVNYFSSVRLNTAAITSLRVWQSGTSSTFAANSRFDLYGISTSNLAGA